MNFVKEEVYARYDTYDEPLLIDEDGDSRGLETGSELEIDEDEPDQAPLKISIPFLPKTEREPDDIIPRVNGEKLTEHPNQDIAEPEDCSGELLITGDLVDSGDECGVPSKSIDLLHEESRENGGLGAKLKRGRPKTKNGSATNKQAKQSHKTGEKRLKIDRWVKYKCPFEGCGYLNFISSLRFHCVKVHVNSEKSLICPKCGRVFPGVDRKSKMEFAQFHNHVTAHEGGKHCLICLKIFYDDDELNDHLSTHKREFVVICQECGFVAQTRSKLLEHKWETHEKETEYKCEDCSTSFKSQVLLDCHQSEDHQFACFFRGCHDESPRRFASKAELLVHVEAAHPNECKYCGELGFNSNENRLDEHTNLIHTDERPIICPEADCGAGFATRKQMFNHALEAHGERKKDKAGEGRIKCDICLKEMAYGAGYWGHRRKVHGIGKFKCGFPDCVDLKVFPSSVLRAKHWERKHGGKKPFTCQVCKAPFGSLHDLKRHSYSHTSENEKSKRGSEEDVEPSSSTANSKLPVEEPEIIVLD